MDSIKKLTELFREFPGIGPRQAKRFVYFLLTRPNSYLSEFSEIVRELKKEIRICSSCFRFFPQDVSSSSQCHICTSKERDHSSLMIVTKDVDLETIEKSHSYNGTYFVLGGTVPILEKNPEIKIRSKELMSTVERKVKENGLKEIIMAMNLNPEGENTEEYITRLLSPLVSAHSITISTLGRGLSTGTELEYSDSETIKYALKNRT